MIDNQYKKIIKLIEVIENNKDCIDVGTAELAPTPNSIARIEKSIKIKLPKSYLWFLENYGYIIIFGQELYIIWNEVDIVAVSNIESNYFMDKKNSVIFDYEIPIFTDEFGQLYIMDTSEVDNKGEYPIYRKFNENGEDKIYYADNFLEFLEKQLKDCNEYTKQH